MTISLHKCGYCGQEYGIVGVRRFMCRCQKGEFIALVVAVALVMCLIGAGLSHVFSLVVPGTTQQEVARDHRR